MSWDLALEIGKVAVTAVLVLMLLVALWLYGNP